MRGKFFNPGTGKQVSGAAAQQMIIKHNGGWEEHHQKFAERVAEETTIQYLKELETDFRRTSIRIVK
ncbi:hypothetical protein ACIQ1D_02420 [Lysinibacillus xylanilyticus]|uniref:hypothetical protein n=1 Tax=Lysinibacillus xylanilyticus TaxID=582475 RepID=UPI003819C4CF